MKLKIFCKVKDMVNKTEWEKIFTKSQSHRGLISKTYKELNKLDYKNKIQLNNGIQI